MNTEILMMVAKSGIFALLFVILLFYVLKDSKARENNYQKVVNQLTEELGAVIEIKQDVEDIKTIVCTPKLCNAEES